MTTSITGFPFPIGHALIPGGAAGEHVVPGHLKPGDTLLHVRDITNGTPPSAVDRTAEFAVSTTKAGVIVNTTTNTSGRFLSVLWASGGGTAEEGPALDPSVSGLTLANTAAIRAGFAAVRAGTRDMRIITVGDSTTATGGVVTGNSRYNSWPARMARLLRDGGLATSHENLVGFNGQGTAANMNASFPNFTFTGQCNPVEESLGGKILGQSAAGTFTFTPSENVTGYRVLYAKSTSAGVFSWRINGGAATNVDRQIGAGYELGELIIDADDVPALATPGLHTISFSWVSGYHAVISIEGLRGERVVNVYNAAISSSKAVDWPTPTGRPYYRLELLQAEQADLVLINLGINDWRAANWTSAYNTALQSLITAAKAGGADVILLCPCPSAETSGESISAVRQGAYNDAILALGASNSVPVVNLRSFYGSGDAAVSAGYLLADGIHQTPEGYAATATLMADTLAYIEQMS
ncbi:SGNH/GDSL hydrolase family protein [Sphingobium lignivorans]|uniref:Lysophospholipase L1-like esterase n=1 Tax=Sphingobium lignivorans TaxID=2735886 RepID=A0ABR6NLN5_9SPHN|nr:SGNH/GDSL hydrolase family protein [Sphingobium lignivorans]MBB5987443.1 lysophospholipase L1-like esterase [Sphingobium lignivorans]